MVRLFSTPSFGVTNLAAARRRSFAVAVLVGMLCGGVAAAVLLNLPPTWTAESALVARPAQTTPAAGGGQFGQVVALGLPAIPDLATSPSVLADVVHHVPGAPPVDQLAKAISVTSEPGTGVVHIAVTAGSPDLAVQINRRLTAAVTASSVMSPSAELVAVGSDPRVKNTSMSTTAVAILVTAVVLICTGLTRSVLTRPPSRGTDVPGIHAALIRAGRSPVAVLGEADLTLAERVRSLQDVHRRPVQVLGVGPDGLVRAEALRIELESGGVSLVTARPLGDPMSVVIVLDARRTQPDEITSTVASLSPASSVLAIVVA